MSFRDRIYTKFKVIPAVVKAKPNSSVVLYHGTTRDRLAKIKVQGLVPTKGWVQGTSGVFLTKNKDTALYWAKLRYMGDLYNEGENVRVDDNHFDKRFGNKIDKLLAVLQVTIPKENVDNLSADMEQAEDVGFTGEDKNWELSLKEIGDVRYNGKIQPSWIKVTKMSGT